MSVSPRWALLLALLGLVALCAVTPAGADDNDDTDCWGCAPGQCVRLRQPTRGGRKLLDVGARTLLDDNDGLDDGRDDDGNDDNDDDDQVDDDGNGDDDNNDDDDDDDDNNDDDDDDDGNDDDDDDDSRRTCRRCSPGYILATATDDGVSVGRCVCNAAQGFGSGRAPNGGNRICVRCRDGHVPLSCSSNLAAAFNMATSTWQLRLGRASSCNAVDWGRLRPEWEVECVPSSVRKRMSVRRANFREFQCVPCSRAGGVKRGNRCEAA